jgi:glyoxylase-like metal-dependent hydrolase (beta-lactamase superfamily II)
MSKTHATGMPRRHFLAAAAAGALSVTGGTIASAQPDPASMRTILKSGDFEVLVVSDGYFVLPTGFLVTPEAPTSEREALLKGTGQGGEQLQMANNITIVRKGSDVILIDAGTGPRHQPSAGKLAENLRAAGIQPAAITKVVLTHGHPDHLWGVLDANDNPIFPNAIHFVSATEWDVWADPDAVQKFPAVMKERAAGIVTGARNHLSRIKDKMVTVREGDEIVSGVRVIDTPGHTPGHISLEVAGSDAFVVAGDALTHPLISFRYPSWRVPVDHEADRGIATRLRLLDQLATNKQRLIGAHFPFPGTGFVERFDSAYRFVTS